MKRILLLCLALMLLSVNALAEDVGLVETVLYEGAAAVEGNWQLAIGVNTTNASGKFDPSLITEDGYFTVEYTGSMKAVYLAVSDWQSGTWASVNVPQSCTQDGSVYTAVFTFDQCYIQFGSKDFSGVDQICAGSTTAAGTTTILRITWHGKPVQDELGADAVLFRGAAVSNAAHANLMFCFTSHVGGDFDASAINPGSRFYVEYAGVRNGVYLALSSHSGATRWAKVNAAEVTELGNGKYASWFDYDDCVRAWGDDFARLDQISVYSSFAGEITLNRVAYFAGEGEAAATSDGSWLRPDTGIAFIGDSICQNALLMYGDWNSILGRTDCCNYGIGGQTTVECRARIDELARRDYHTIVIICGINDIGHGYTKEEIVANIVAMVEAVRAQNPDCRFLLVSVLPTTSAYYTGQQAKINLLNLAYKRYSSKTDGVTYVDVYSSFTPKTGEYAYPELLSDGLHPNREGYAVMAEILTEYLPENEESQGQ